MKTRYKTRQKYTRPTSKCPSKKKYHRTEIDAKLSLMKTANYVEMQGGDREKPVRAYKCNLCSGWHLTSRPLKQKVSND